MIRAHVAGVIALLTGSPTVYDGKVPDSTNPPYRVVYANGGLAIVTNTAGDSNCREWSFQTTAVGSTPEQARAVAEKNQTALLDSHPTVSGRTCGPIRHETSRSVERDDDVSPPVFYAVDVWRFMSLPT